jgi:putative sterol carrier protein
MLAFVPWILYWVLAGTGNTTAAILCGLGVSLAINGYRLATRKVKILDAVSLVFMAVAAFITLVLRSDFMVFYGGVLSDATLALMAWGSLLVGNPFTYDYAKEDWDEALWDNPIFIQTNQIITAVWGAIFTVQALIGGTSMVLDLEGTARIILVAVIPRSLLIGGIAFSAWFPRWYPPRAAARLSAGDSAEDSTSDETPDGLGGLQLIEAMPLAFNAEVAKDLRATIQFRLNGEGGGAGYLKIESGRCTFHTGDVEQPTLAIESTAQVWTAISRGEKNGAEAFLNQDYRTEGDLGLLMQLDKLFSAHPPEAG